jgi:hypothetical protein
MQEQWRVIILAEIVPIQDYYLKFGTRERLQGIEDNGKQRLGIDDFYYS